MIIELVEDDCEIIAKNKYNVFAALRQSDVKSVMVYFDGCADDGQMTEWEVELRQGEYISDPELLPKVSVERLAHCWHQKKRVTTTALLAVALEDLCYDLLDESYSGWGNNDGSYGALMFDVEQSNVTLEYNRRTVHTTTMEV